MMPNNTSVMVMMTMHDVDGCDIDDMWCWLVMMVAVMTAICGFDGIDDGYIDDLHGVVKLLSVLCYFRAKFKYLKAMHQKKNSKTLRWVSHTITIPFTSNTNNTGGAVITVIITEINNMIITINAIITTTAIIINSINYFSPAFFSFFHEHWQIAADTPRCLEYWWNIPDAMHRRQMYCWRRVCRFSCFV